MLRNILWLHHERERKEQSGHVSKNISSAINSRRQSFPFKLVPDSDKSCSRSISCFQPFRPYWSEFSRYRNGKRKCRNKRWIPINTPSRDVIEARIFSGHWNTEGKSVADRKQGELYISFDGSMAVWERKCRIMRGSALANTRIPTRGCFSLGHRYSQLSQTSGTRRRVRGYRLADLELRWLSSIIQPPLKRSDPWWTGKRRSRRRLESLWTTFPRPAILLISPSDSETSSL